MQSSHDKMCEIYHIYYSTMMYAANSVLNDRVAAGDVVSEAIEKIFHNIDKINDVSCYRTNGYVVTIVKNIALSALKKKKQLREDSDDELEYVPDADISVIEKLTVQESCDAITQAILDLPEKLSAVLYLSAVHEFTNQEIAKELGISVDNVKTRLSRAKKLVKKKISEMGDYDDYIK